MKIPHRQRERLAKLMALEQRGVGAEADRAREARARILARYGVNPDDLEVRPRVVERVASPTWQGLALGAAESYRLPCRLGPMAIEVTCDAVMLQYLRRWADSAEGAYQPTARLISRIFVAALEWAQEPVFWPPELDPVFEGIQDTTEALEARHWGKYPLYHAVKELPSAVPGLEDSALLYLGNSYERLLLGKRQEAPWERLTAEARQTAYALGPLLSHLLREGAHDFAVKWFEQRRTLEDRKRAEAARKRAEEEETARGGEAAPEPAGHGDPEPAQEPKPPPLEPEEAAPLAPRHAWMRSLEVVRSMSRGTAAKAARTGSLQEPEDPGDLPVEEEVTMSRRGPALIGMDSELRIGLLPDTPGLG